MIGLGATRRTAAGQGVDSGPDPGRSGRWVLGVLSLAAVALHGWGLARGAPHYYYSAAVRSMSGSWPTWFFGALDPAGSITLDKLPGAFWMQSLLVRVVGFHDWVLLLPGTAATIATVPMLHLTVHRFAGRVAADVAAVLQLASPVTFAAAQINLADPMMVFLLVAAAYAMDRALDGRRSWLWLTAVLVGAAFQVKMLSAWLVLPAFIAVYVIGSTAPMRARLRHLAVFVAGTAVVSLSWVIAVALIPVTARPYVDGSTSDSPWQMVFSYNGFGRAVGEQNPLAIPFAGSPGPLRLLNDQFGGQIGWLLPFAVIVGVAGAVAQRRSARTAAGWVLWGGWLLAAGAAISVADGGHPYYATMLAPAISALGAAGLTALASAIRKRRAESLVLGAAMAVSAGCGIVLAARAPAAAWTFLLVVAIGGLGLIGVVTALARRSATTVVAFAVVAVSVGPTAWIAASPPVPPSSVLTANPVAGPPTPEAVFGTRSPTAGLMMMFGTAPGSPPPPVATPLLGATPDDRLVAYLERERGSAHYLFAAGEASSAAAYISAGHSVLPMGGFTAAMPYPTTTQLGDLVDDGQLRFVSLIPMPGIRGPADDRQVWIADRCTQVDPHLYGSTPSYTTLYDCAPSQRHHR